MRATKELAPPTTGQTKTAIYARYSSHNQDDGTSVDVQLEVCRRAAGVPCREYIDRAVTGTTMSRVAFDRLLTDCQNGLIDTVYVYKWDRFGRSARAHVVVADLEDMNVQVISATEGKEPLSRGIQLVVAEDFSRKLSERVTAAKKLRFQQGGWHGGTVPYGYRVVGDGQHKRLAPDQDGEAQTVRFIYTTYLSDCVGFKQLARELNRRGVKPRRSAHWTGGSVRMILANTLYAGRPARLGRATNAQQYHDRAWHNGHHRLERKDEALRIVSDEEFEQVQRKQRGRKSLRPTGRNQTRRFSRLLTCGCCGHTFVRRLKGGEDDSRARWGCGLRVRIDTGLCSNRTQLSETHLVQSIQRGFQRVFDDADQIIAEATREAEGLARANRRQLGDLGKQVAGLDAELARLAKLLTDPDLTEPAVKRLISQQVAQKTAERDQMDARRTELAHGADDLTERLARTVRAAFEEARHSLANVASDPEFNQFVQDFVGPIIVNADGTIRPGPAPAAPGAHVAEAIQYRLLDRKH